MVLSVSCPACGAANPPERTHCHSCGRRLPRPDGIKASSAPVALRRVMSGEIFAAVTGSAAREEPVDEEPPREDPHDPAPEAVVPDVRPIVAGFADRLRHDAEVAKERFKPYRPPTPRRAESEEARRAVSRQVRSAATAIREKRLDAAIQHLLQAIAKDDGDPRTWALLGGTYLRLERPFKAAVGFLRALELDPQNETAWLGLARCFKAAGDSAGALEVLEQTVRAKPVLVDAWFEKGLALEALGNLSEAVKSFARTLELRPDHKGAREKRDTISANLVEELQAPEREATAEDREAALKASAPETPEAVEESEEFPDFTDLAAAPAARGAAAAALIPSRPSRVRTYVEGLDEAIDGGVPWGHVVLIQGSPGTMKSSLGFAILLQNAIRDGRHGLYISLEERTSSLLKQMGSLGLKLQVDRGSLVVLDPRTAKGLFSDRKDWIEGFQHAIAAIQAERGLDMLVIDSLEALEVLAKFKDHRREMYRLFEWLRDLGLTSFLITERPDWVIAGHVIQGRWDEDFLADGVIHLRQHLVTDLEVQRRLRVVKMRGTRHETGYMALVLDEGRFKATRAMSP